MHGASFQLGLECPKSWADTSLPHRICQDLRLKVFTPERRLDIMHIVRFLLVTLCLATSASAQDAAARSSVRAAYAAQAKGKWDEALRLAAQAGTVAVERTNGGRPRALGGQVLETIVFLSPLPDGPSTNYLH